MPRLSINQHPHQVDVDPDTPLLWVFAGHARFDRDPIRLRYRPVRRVHSPNRRRRDSVLLGAGQLGRRSPNYHDRGPVAECGLHPVQKAWIAHDVPQCGYCQSGMIMAVAALLKDKPQPTDADIDTAITNICRCGTYARIRTAIHTAAAA
jgi:isoquinoline 1-oxidoreductase subunit alpha